MFFLVNAISLNWPTRHVF